MTEFDQAIAELSEAVALQPMNAAAWATLSDALRESGQLTEAESVARRATKLDPELAEGWISLGCALRDRAKHDQSLAALARVADSNPGALVARSRSLLGRCYLESKPEALAAAHREFGELLGRAFPERPFSARPENRRIRVGYICGSFRLHWVAACLETLLTAHDRERFDIYLYSDVEGQRANEYAAQTAVEWKNCRNLSDAELWAIIRTDNIDVLVDLAGHGGRRLAVFALRAAPTQVTWLGYPFTTGLRTMDFRITDGIADPADSDEHYTERLLRLPGPFLCYRPSENAPAVARAPISKNGHVTFGSFNHLAKLSEETVVIFSALLQACEGSRLLLKCKSFGDIATARSTIDRFMQYGVSPKRLTLKGHIDDPRQHLAMYGEVDVALDPFPHNGGTTTLEALWMGVPVLTLRGHWHATRVGASIMTHLGLTTLVADTPDTLLVLARDLSRQPETFIELRPVLRQMVSKSLLCDPRSFARNFEDAIVTAMQARNSL